MLTTMTDRELLELAAKAAGYEVLEGWTKFTVRKHEADSYPLAWNPLDDDGDALRLAVKLHLHILHNDPGEAVLWVSAVLNKRWLHAAEEFSDEESRLAAMRRAIVRAAAEIGKAMP